MLRAPRPPGVLGGRERAHVGIAERAPARDLARHRRIARAPQIVTISGNRVAAHPAFVREMRREALDPVALCRIHRSIEAPSISAHQCVGHELADARQEFGAHARMESLRVARADRQNVQGALRSQRASAPPSRSRRNPCRTESRAAHRGSVRIAACPDCSSDSNVLISGSAASALLAGSGRVLGSSARAASRNSTSTEFLASKSSRRLVSTRVDRLGQRARADQALGQAMDAVGERVVGARHIHQFLQFALERSDCARAALPPAARPDSPWRPRRADAAGAVWRAGGRCARRNPDRSADTPRRWRR